MEIKGLTSRDVFLKLEETYGRNNVVYAIDHTRGKAKVFFCSFFGIKDTNGVALDTTIANNYSLEEKTEFINKLEQSIKHYIAYDNEQSMTELMNMIDEYGEENFNDGLAFLDAKSATMIKWFLGIDGEDKKTPNEIDEILHIKDSIKQISCTIDELRTSLSKLATKKQRSFKTISQTISKYGNTNTFKVIEEFGEKWGDILTVYFGLDGGDPASCKVVNDMFSMRINSVSIFSLVDKVEQRLKTDAALDSQFAALIKQYGFERVTKVIETISEPEKSILEMRMGLNGNRKTQYIDIKKKFGIDESREMIHEIVEQFEKLEAKVPKETKREFKPLVICSSNPKDIKAAIDNLPVKEKNLISSFYGINGQKRLTGMDLEVKFKMDQEDILYALGDIIEKINNSIKSKNKR